MENFDTFSRPTEIYEFENPESIALQRIPGIFWVNFWRQVSLIFYRNIDCKGTSRSIDYRDSPWEEEWSSQTNEQESWPIVKGLR